MKEEFSNEADLNLQALGRAVATFFTSREKGSNSDVLGKLCERLAGATAKGSSHLRQEEYEELSANPAEFSAVGYPKDDLPLVLTDWGGLYFRRFYEYELEVSHALCSRAKRGHRNCDGDTFAFFDQYVRPHLDPSQCLAVGVGLQRDLCLVTGGPGSGKTRTLVLLLACILKDRPDWSIALSAPTGKAANRLKQALDKVLAEVELPAQIKETILSRIWVGTLHRLLGPVHGSVDFRKDHNSPLSHNLVVVDEASMVDLPLMGKLCSALGDESMLILAGDPDQLAPVQGGAIFHSLSRDVTANQFSAQQFAKLAPFSKEGDQAQDEVPLCGCHVRLIHSHRFGQVEGTDEIGGLCLAIREGRAEDALELIRSSTGSLRLIHSSEDQGIPDIIRQGYEELLKNGNPEQALQRLGDFRILCAHNQGRHGVASWNERTQKIFSPEDDCAVPIVIGSNDYSVGLFNGDDGVVINDQAFFAGSSELRKISRSRLPNHLPGYAISIHRSQGSEFKKVMIVLPPELSRVLTRELLYVAVSRSKKGITFVGTEQSFIQALQTQSLPSCGIVKLVEESSGV